MLEQRRHQFPNVSQAAHGITHGCFRIVAIRKVDYPNVVTIPGSSDVRVWKSFADVREYIYFGWKDKKVVVVKLLATQQTRVIEHHKGVQLRYTLDGTTPTSDFNNPRH